jgi:phenylalanyl-tRNA synthetase alpha chain
LEGKILSAKDLKSLEKIRIEIFGKKGFLAEKFSKLKDIPDSEKKEFAKNLNIEKTNLNRVFNDTKERLYLEHIQKSLKEEAIDVTMYSHIDQSGAFHPVQSTMDTIIDYFTTLNFEVEEGPLIEDDFYNFEALNLPIFHPARDMQDTFYLNNNLVLRTHTSPVQIRYMQKNRPPFRMISPGSVFRRDSDLTHTPMFHQVEGLVVDKTDKVSFANLKFILEDFLKYMFGDVKVRFRPSFFPFTEPSSEVDISCIFCNNRGCRVCSNSGWLEVLGSGMVNINVFSAIGEGYEDVSGYAFGLGVERFAMLRHKISDLRSLFDGDIRLLEQFR